MFIDNSRFIQARSSFPVPVVPPVGEPDGGNLVQVCFAESWLPYILGALEQLINAATWKCATVEERDIMQQRANNLIYLFQIAAQCKPAPSTAGGADGDENLIRQNPDNPCQLQTSIDGITWCTFADFSKCVPAASQPGGNQPQPAPGGGEECYKGNLLANQTFLIPTVVSTGDVIHLASISGAGTDNGITWFCPDGGSYFAGTCSGLGSTDTSDPLPTAKHMAIILLIGSTAYDISSGDITVPSGVANQQIYLQVNTPNLSVCSGSYQFSVCVTNNQALSFTHTFNLLLATGPFRLATSGELGGDNPAGEWVGGVGWSWQDMTSPSPSDYRRKVAIAVDLPSRVITSVSMTYSLIKGAQMDTNTPCVINDTDVVIYSAATNGDNQTLTTNPGAARTALVFEVLCSRTANIGDLTGGCQITKVVVNGEGSDPF